MQFTVNTEKRTIKATGLKFSVSIPQEQEAFWTKLVDQATDMVYSSKSEVTHIRYNAGKIEFGHGERKELTPPEERTPEAEIQYEETFNAVFVFDLSDYKLKSPSGAAFKPDIITHNLRCLQVFGSCNWLTHFYDMWKSYAYPSDSKKIKACYMFSLKTQDLERLQAAEKLFRSGYVQSASNIKNVLGGCRPENLTKSRPWEILDVPRCVYESIVGSARLQQEFRYYGFFRNIREFTHWGDIWQILVDLQKEEDMLCLIASNSDLAAVFQDLVENKAYDRKRLFEYLFVDLPEKQGFKAPKDAVKMLQDYAAMCDAALGCIENKYPKYLKTEHDIIISKFNEVKTALEDAKCMQAYEGKDLSYSSRKFFDTYPDSNSRGYYRLVAPRSSQDIVDEGKVMHHCVATYIPKIKNPESKCLIAFVRTYDGRSYYNPDITHHLTVEFHDKEIVQARGLYNRDPNATELRFLKECCEAKEFTLCEDLRSMYERIVGQDYDLPFDAGLEENRKEAVAC